MDSEDVKQILIAYNSLKDSCKAIIKPIRINLNDTETMITMPKAQESALEWIKSACESIQEVLETMESGIDDLKESIYDDGEIAEARKMIRDILFDIPPIPKPEKTNLVELPFDMEKYTKKVVMGAKR